MPVAPLAVPVALYVMLAFAALMIGIYMVILFRVVQREKDRSFLVSYGSVLVAFVALFIAVFAVLS